MIQMRLMNKGSGRGIGQNKINMDFQSFVNRVNDLWGQPQFIGLDLDLDLDFDQQISLLDNLASMGHPINLLNSSSQRLLAWLS